MPHFQVPYLLHWIHFVGLAAFGGSALCALLVSGLEEDQEAFRGLAAALWARVARWALRGAALAGLALLVLQHLSGLQPFADRQFLVKLALAALALALAETAPRALALRNRGAAMLALVLFLVSGLLAIHPGLLRARTLARPMAQLLHP